MKETFESAHIALVFSFSKQKVLLNPPPREVEQASHLLLSFLTSSLTTSGLLIKSHLLLPDNTASNALPG